MNRLRLLSLGLLPLGLLVISWIFLLPPFMPLSTQRASQLRALRFGMFVCWSLSSFSGQEWTRGTVEPSLFSPTGFFPDEWATTARKAEMKYILLLAKHHDGFCLWDTATTEHKVTRSPLRVDVVEGVRAAAARNGLKLALYFSEGDWTWPPQGDGQQKKAQLKELLTRYGPIEFLWLDPSAGDGGLDHEETTRFVKSLQPSCMVGFGNGPPSGDLRLGEYGHPAWLTNPAGAGYGHSQARKYRYYQAAEFTFPIFNHLSHRWFYTDPSFDHLAMPAETIHRLYKLAERYDNLFDLAVAPDRGGHLRAIDRSRLEQVGRLIRGEPTRESDTGPGR